MKNVDIVIIKGVKYLVDLDLMKIGALNLNDDFVIYKTALRNPGLINRLPKPSDKFVKMLEKNSRTYNKEIHKFGGGT